MNPSINPDRIISRAQFRKLTGISRTTEWRLSQEGKLPPAFKLDGRVLGYRESAYNTWLKQHSAAIQSVSECRANSRRWGIVKKIFFRLFLCFIAA